ncbi:hypothetical protein [Nostoc sp. C110]
MSSPKEEIYNEEFWTLGESQSFLNHQSRIEQVDNLVRNQPN